METYGVPSYKEANPSFFTTVTFPFLFGVMFGDIAHGGLLLAFGLYLVFRKNQITNILFKLLIPHRYLICMMGFFAMYCGFIYNDFMSISLNIFGSCYNPIGVDPGDEIPRTENCVYGFGVDPVWSVAENSLNYLNSLKMKISVIIAVVHMTLGVFIKASNALFHKKYIDLFLEFIPQLIFMLTLFGYMDFLIVFKWLQYWPNIDVAPSIITTMINFPLKLGKTVLMVLSTGRLLWRIADVGNVRKHLSGYCSACLADHGVDKYSHYVDTKTNISHLLQEKTRRKLLG